MQKRLIALFLALSMVCIFILAGCGNDIYKPVKQVGKTPEVFEKIIENNLFCDIVPFENCLLKAEIVSEDTENRTVTGKVCMLDLYGNTLAEYTCTYGDAYGIQSLTATADGGFLFVVGFTDRSYGVDTWASDNGYASRIIKCDKNGQLQFEKAMEQVEGYALRVCIEQNDCFYFFGTIETPETKKTGINSPDDVYMTVLDQSGAVLKTKTIAGTDYDSLDAAEVSGDGFKLSVSAQSDDGDFAGSNSGGYPKDWVITVDGDLAITEKKMETGRDFLDNRLGQKDGAPIYQSDGLFENYDAGTPSAYIGYDDFYLIISSNITGEYEKTPLMVSAIWYYTETVYSAYDYDGKLLFRRSVDSSPDFDAWAEGYMN